MIHAIEAAIFARTMTREKFHAQQRRAVELNFKSRNVRCVSGDAGDRAHKRIKAQRRASIRRFIRFARASTPDAWPKQSEEFRAAVLNLIP